MKRTIVLIASLLVALQCRAVDTEELRQLVGFTVIAVTEVPGEFEGGDFDKTVKLANEMVFEFMSYGYMYAYQPATAVFAKKLSPEQQAKLGKQSSKEIVLYKLLIEDDIYDVIRLR